MPIAQVISFPDLFPSVIRRHTMTDGSPESDPSPATPHRSTSISDRSSPDVRMRGFQHRSTVEQAWDWVQSHVSRNDSESTDATRAAGRVLADDVRSPVDVPQFQRAMMDGYAVLSSDTEGASPQNRLPLSVIGEVYPGQATALKLTHGQAVRIMTGAPMPAGADAVIPVEYTELEQNTVYLTDALPAGKHVGAIGEDIQQGQTTHRKGRRLRPQDIGVLSSIGVDKINVYRRPRVRLLITGNELLPAGSQPQPHRIVDANSPMLNALVERDGGVVTFPGICPDSPEAISQVLSDEQWDVLLISGGSSVGKEDHAPVLLAQHGTLDIHGIAMRPSSPAGMGQVAGRPVFLLPGNPVSCLCAYDFFAGRAIRILGGRHAEWPYASRTLPLARKLVSQIGRVDYARVRIEDHRVHPIAIRGASALSSTTRADGFVIIDQDSEGHAPGNDVRVWLY